MINMFLLTICIITNILIKIVIALVVLLVLFVIALKLYMEPIKGVCKCKTKLNGRVALVTGGNSGIGLETARDLAARGAKVIIACRNGDRSNAAVTDIRKTTGNPDVHFKYLDLSSFDSVRKFAKNFNETEDRLDILVNNAGCAGLNKRITGDGIDIVMQINYFGPFLLTNLLLNKMEQPKTARIVIVSSYAHHHAKLAVEDLIGTKTEGYWTSYANSKLCNILWARGLAKRLPNGITASVLHPGIVKTDIFKRLPKIWRVVILKVLDLVFKSPKEGAQTTIHLCVSPELVNASGGYYSDCKPCDSSALAKNEDLIEKVWRESVRVTTEKL